MSHKSMSKIPSSPWSQGKKKGYGVFSTQRGDGNGTKIVGKSDTKETKINKKEDSNCLWMSGRTHD